MTEHNTLWIFDCPFHGWEISAFCFRAYDENLKENWFKVALNIIDFNDDERNEFFKSIKKSSERNASFY